MQGCLALAQKARRYYWFAVGCIVRCTVGPAHFTPSMQHAICDAVLGTELDDAGVIYYRLPALKLLPACIFTRGMQSKHAMAVPASKCYDRGYQHDNKLATGFHRACHRRRVRLHVHHLLCSLCNAQQQSAVRHDIYVLQKHCKRKSLKPDSTCAYEQSSQSNVILLRDYIN